MQQTFPRSRGMTILDLVFALGIMAFCTTLALCIAAESGEAAKRAQCSNNLRQDWKHMRAYSNTQRNGSYPRGRYDLQNADKPKAYTAAAAKNPFDADGPVNDVTAAMFLLLRTTDLKPQIFVCPSAEQKPLDFAAPTTAHDSSNFPNRACLSYSLCNPFASNEALSAGFKWNNTLNPTFALAGDMNPGGDDLIHLTAASSAAELRKGNSRNHNQDGQNVLFGDGHVEFTQTPFCAGDQDNIYTYGPSGKTSGGTGVKGPPMAFADCVLLPTAADDAPPK